jgi:hypothetical protein
MCRMTAAPSFLPPCVLEMMREQYWPLAPHRVIDHSSCSSSGVPLVQPLAAGQVSVSRLAVSPVRKSAQAVAVRVALRLAGAGGQLGWVEVGRQLVDGGEVGRNAAGRAGPQQGGAGGR